jgi:hypothetical protein
VVARSPRHSKCVIGAGDANKRGPTNLRTELSNPEDHTLLNNLQQDYEKLVVSRNIHQQQNSEMIVAGRKRRREKANIKGLLATVMTVEEIEAERKRLEAEEAAATARKKARTKQTAANKLQKQIWEEVLPIHVDLIWALQH